MRFLQAVGLALISALVLESPGSTAAAGVIPCPHDTLGPEAAPGALSGLELVADSRGGYAAWFHRDTTDQCEVMRLDPFGHPAWPKAVAASRGSVPFRTEFAACSDGAGGLVLAWFALREPLRGEASWVVLQRVDSTGRCLWGRGVRLGGHAELIPMALVPGGDGGAIAVWQNGQFRDGRIAAQRVDGRGRPKWREVLVTPEHAPQSWPAAAGDDSGGVVVCWTESAPLPPLPKQRFLSSICGLDEKPSTAPGPWIRAQRIDVQGRRRWGPSGIVLSDSSAQALYAHVVRSGNGGVHVLWHQRLTGRGMHVVRLDSSTGCEIWRESFTGATEVGGTFTTMVPDERGGVFIGWTEGAPGVLVAQHLDVDGYRLWGARGRTVADRGNHVELTISPDAAGGAYVASRSELKAYHLDAWGSAGASGEALCPGSIGTTDLASVRRGDGAGLLVWLHHGPRDQLVVQEFGPEGIRAPGGAR